MTEFFRRLKDAITKGQQRPWQIAKQEDKPQKTSKKLSTKSPRSKLSTKVKPPTLAQVRRQLDKPLTLAQARRQLEDSRGDVAMIEFALACGPAFAYRTHIFCIGVVHERLLRRKQTSKVKAEIVALLHEYMNLPDIAFAEI